MTDFATALATFLNKANDLLEEGINAENKGWRFTKKLVAQPGRTYVRIVMLEGDNQHGSAFCFIDKENGDVLKAASWKAPAKNFARGNIYDENNGLGRFCWTGMR